MFSALLSAVVFGRSLDSPELMSQILWENFEKFGETLRQHLPSLSALVRFLISWGGPGARGPTVWTQSERSLFPFLLSFTFIVCGCFVKFLCTSVKHSSPSIAFSFSCFSLKVQGETDGGGGWGACLVLAWGPRALLWEAAWTVNGGRSHSEGDDTHVYKGMKYCNAHWCQNMKWKVWCPFGQ